MRDWKLPWPGGCRCGGVRFVITAPPLVTGACHCTGCQHMTASAYSLSVAVPSEGFSVTQGEPVIGGLHREPRHYFCGYCMSWMFTRLTGMDFFVNVRATLLDDCSWFRPYMETWTREKLPWVELPVVRSYEALPAMEDYEVLVRDFAAHAEREAPPQR